MARLCAVADGNNTSASTWALIDSTSFNEGESSAIAVPTSYSTSYTQFTPGAITIDGIGLRLANRTGTTGTFSVELYNHTAGGSVAGTEVTIDCSDFVDALTASVDGGWYFFKFSSVTLLAANAYSVRFKTSTSNQLNMFGTTSSNPSRFLRTTTTQAPVAGDDRIVTGEWTAAATTTTRTVTLDDTSTVDYGSGSNSLVTPAFSICAGGIVLAGTTASTTYVQKISGIVTVFNGGTLRLGTSGSRMPTASSFTWTFDCATNADFGIDIRRKGEFTAYGESKTRWTTLTEDEAAAQTVIGVASTTGWKTTDSLVFAPTGTTVTQAETKSISTVDSSTQVTLSAGLTNAHTGTGDVVGEVGNLTSNVTIIGASSTLGTFITFRESSLGVLDNVTVKYFGSNTTNKLGVTIAHTNTSTNSVTINSSVFTGYISGFSGGILTTLSTAAYFTITNNIIFTNMNNGTVTGMSLSGGASGTPSYTIEDNCIIGLGSGGGVNFTGYKEPGGLASFDSNRISGCSTGISMQVSLANTNGHYTEVTNCIVHSNSAGISSNGNGVKRISDCALVRNNGYGIQTFTGIAFITNCNFYGNSSGGIQFNSIASQYTVQNCNFRGATSFVQTYGVLFGTAGAAPFNATFTNCTFGDTIAHTTSDIGVLAFVNTQLTFNNCTLSSSTEITSTVYNNLLGDSYVAFQRRDNTDGNHIMYIRYGIVTPDTTIYRTASPSIRITPKSATVETTSSPFTFKVPINNGQTATPTIYVRESVVGDGTDYNGNRIKLYVKANYNLGITSDTLLDTATSSSEGDWEALTGTTAAVTDDGVLEFYITCDGTTGWINYDDVTATTD